MSLAVFVLFFLAYYFFHYTELGDVTLFPNMFISFSFAGHSYSQIVAFGFTLVGALALLYGLQGAKAIEQLVALIAVISTIGIVFANDFITLFLFWELLTISASGLILLNSPQSKHVFSMGMRFLILHLMGGLLVLFGVLQHYALTNSLALVEPEAGLICFMLGFGIKTAFIPIHLWVVWGYPSASLFSSVVLAGLSTKAGVYAIARILPPDSNIVLMGALMAIVGVACALVQNNMRHLLSYHIISQVGYMVAGVGLGLFLSTDGGLLHLVNHMLYKALLFMSAGVVLYSTGTENVKELNSFNQESHHNQVQHKQVWKALPIATIGAVVGALAISGAPLFNGYVSKSLLKEAFYGVEPAGTMLLIASIGTATSFSKFIYLGFLRARTINFRPPTFSMQFSILTVSLLCILLGIRPGLIAGILPHGSSLSVYSSDGVLSALQIVAVGIFVYGLIYKILLKGIPYVDHLSIEKNVILPIAGLFQVVTRYAGDRGGNIERNLNKDQIILASLLVIVLILIFITSILGS